MAETEALAATQAGVHAALTQAEQRGILSEIRQSWQTIPDERRRPSHAAMQGQERPLGVPFTSGLGNSLRFPGDPQAPVEDRIRCRCHLETVAQAESPAVVPGFGGTLTSTP